MDSESIFVTLQKGARTIEEIRHFSRIFHLDEETEYVLYGYLHKAIAQLDRSFQKSLETLSFSPVVIIARITTMKSQYRPPPPPKVSILRETATCSAVWAGQ
ncbi:uncharacterized protein LOC113331381 [Papaver somniferum]|uniref:uncharacterized protein LOC113331381 n=1 Tax=Papaver somniferum TaxID=3469 RepID=UPI000E702B17|nr:uncharacterized protein LOC113331381 [Papaver somniferum]